MNGRPTIVLVDDEQVALDLIGRALSSEGAYNIVMAQDIGQAQRLAELHTPALMIIDVSLKDENGLDLTRWVRQNPLLTGTMVIMLTGAAQLEQKLVGFEAGADEYITKPFHPPELLSRVRAMLRIQRMQEELTKDRAELGRLNDALAANLAAATALLVNIISLRVPNASDRSDRACPFARWLGEQVGMNREELAIMDLAVKVREIGKISFTDELLGKSHETLTREDRATLQAYPLFGQMSVGNVPQLRPVGKLIRHQLENFDGTGIPDRLMGEEIPMASRIMRILAFIEEEREGGETAVREALARGRGTIFDPSLLPLADEYIVGVEKPGWLEGKQQVSVHRLERGMVIAADLFTASGIKLLPAGSTITPFILERILSRNEVDPIISWVYVLASGQAPR
jgi:response regulator RpfG family c-di-GMP phosphodiesterase